jgi:hypothetical protein
MNKKLTVALSKLLKLDEKVIEEALLKEDGDDSILKAYTDKYQSYTAEELSTLLGNSNKQYLEKADFDIKEVPKALYSKIAGAVLEVREKKLSEEYGIKDYKDLQDLLAKIAELGKGKGADEALKQQNEAQKETIKKLELEKETELKTEREKHEAEFIGLDFNTALNSLPLDYEKETVDTQKKLITYAFNSELKTARKNNKTIVLDKDGKAILDKVGDPMPISDVLKNFVTVNGFKLKEPETGGRGSGNSENKLTLKGLSLQEAINRAGVKPNTEEADAVYLEWQSANPK